MQGRAPEVLQQEAGFGRMVNARFPTEARPTWLRKYKRASSPMFMRISCESHNANAAVNRLFTANRTIPILCKSRTGILKPAG
jgi:hypothetical protein